MIRPSDLFPLSSYVSQNTCNWIKKVKFISFSLVTGLMRKKNENNKQHDEKLLDYYLQNCNDRIYFSSSVLVPFQVWPSFST